MKMPAIGVDLASIRRNKMASPTIIDPDGGEPEVTVNGTNLIRYDCIFTLWKPKGETWPETGERGKVIHE